jgi:hypothetical protein
VKPVYDGVAYDRATTDDKHTAPKTLVCPRVASVPMIRLGGSSTRSSTPHAPGGTQETCRHSPREQLVRPSDPTA